MISFQISRQMARLIILQRIELLETFSKKIRKILGRYLFTSFISRFFFNPNKIGEKYFKLMRSELMELDRFIDFDKKKILSIGSGIGGFEAVLNHSYNNNYFTFIEKDIVSKKVKYGWDTKNKEAYNNLGLLNSFLLLNGMNKENFEIFNFDKDQLPKKKFDIIISLYSLDYHYDFNLYIDYLKNVLTDDTLIIFDTIRPEYFSSIFRNVDIIKNDNDTVHKSKRIICKNII